MKNFHLFILGLLCFGLIFALPVLAKNTNASKDNKKSLDIACVQSLLEKRETALAAGLHVYQGSMETALNNRLSGLKAAWAITDQAQRKIAIKKVWSDYKTTLNKARKAFNNAKTLAWKNFYTNRKACGTQAISDDHTTSGIDNNL